MRACYAALMRKTKDARWRAVLAIRKIVTAARELTQAEQDLLGHSKTGQKGRRKQAIPQVEGTSNGQDAREVANG